MANTEETLKQLNQEIEAAISNYEQKNELEKALETYRNIENQLRELAVSRDDPVYKSYQAVLAYCLLRQANMLRQMGKAAEANELGFKEVAAARESGDQLALARSLLSYGASLIDNDEREKGGAYLQEARTLFEQGQGEEYQQGLGWYWIVCADLMNAGIVPAHFMEVIETANEAIDILLPIKNWPGVARAFEARAKAYEGLGEKEKADSDRRAKARYENMI
jgi:hypothetical protein